MKKKLLIGAGVLVVVLVGGIAVLLANLDKVVSSRKDTILARAEEQIGRTVTVDEIKVGVWPGIGVSLKGVAVADDPAFSTEPFVTVGDLRVNVKLLPLLKKRVEVKRLVLGDAAVNVIVGEDGKRNFDSMVPASAQAQGDVGGGGEAAAPAGAAATALVLAYADIDNGSVHIVDRARGFDHTVGKIRFTAQNVSLDSEIALEFSAALVGDDTDTRVEGTVGPLGEFKDIADLADAPLAVTVAFGPVDAARVMALVPAKDAAAPAPDLGLGELDAKLAVRGTLGALNIEDIVASVAVLGVKEANATLRAGVTGINALSPEEKDKIAVKGELRVDPVPVAALMTLSPPPAAASKPAPVLTGDASLACTFDGAPERLNVHATLDGDRVDVTVPETFHKAAGVAMNATVDGVFTPPALNVSKGDIRFNTLHASVTGVAGPEAVDLNVTSDPTDVATWKDLLPALAPLSPSGSVVVRARITAAPASKTPPQVDGTLTLSGGGARLAQLPAPVHDASATVTFTPTSAKVEKAQLSVGRSVIHATVDVPTLEPLTATYRVTSDRVYRDDVQAHVGKPAPRPEVLDKVVAEGKVRMETPDKAAKTTKPVPPAHTTKVTSQSGVIANLDYTAMTASLHSEGDALVIDSYSAGLLDGSVEGTGRVEPTAVPPRFDIVTHVKQANLARYFDQSFPALGKFIEGRIDLDVNVAGAGKDWNEIAKTLAGSGDAIVVRGALLNFNLANELLAGLQTVPLVPSGFAERVRARNPKLFANSTTTFENLKGALAFADGRMSAKDLVLKSADFSISGDGWFAFDRTMNLNSTVVFSQKLSGDIVGELPLAKYLLDSSGRISLPLSLGGDVLAPRLSLDTNALAAKFQRSAVDEGRDKLQGQLKEGVKEILGGFGKKKDADKKDAPPDTTGTRKTP